ncbi:major facilitator superfamily domain-containing protein [Kalaharituber pfeilii]|nr:major facilitator superfamily domain-containing protein [Kalaharituber pfeilii]
MDDRTPATPRFAESVPTATSSTTVISSSASASSTTSAQCACIVSEKELELGITANGEDRTESIRVMDEELGDLKAGNETEVEKYEVNWEGHDDPQNPLNWPMLTKSFVLISVSLQTLMVILYSTSFLSGSPGIMKEFGITSSTTITLGMTAYMFGLACGPLVLAPMSELYGRRPVYIISLGLFFIFILPACVAKNYETIAIVRFFGAFVGSVTIANAPGSLGDIFHEEYRTLAFSCFCLAPMNGPVLGPLTGGLVYEYLGWRWTNWIVFIGAGVAWLSGILIPETYAPILLKRKAAKIRTETGDERYRSRFCPKAGDPPIKTGSRKFWQLIANNMKRPIIMGVTEPICIFWEVYIAIIYAILYLCFVGYPIVFTQLRGWSPAISGLAFSGIGTGTIMSLCLDPLNSKVYEMHKIDPDTGKRPPEARIACLCLASVISPASLIWFSWTCYPTTIHWVWPILAGVPYGMANTMIFLHGNNYLVDSYGRYAASALAGNTVARSMLGGILPLFGSQMYSRLGPNWAGTLVACLAFVIMPIPWGFYKWGKNIRMRSPMLKVLQEEARQEELKMARIHANLQANKDEKSTREAAIKEIA